MFVPGDPLGFHQSTHEEPSIPSWAYQPRVHEYNVASMELFASFLKELDAIHEGDGTLLDHSLVMAFTDQAYARIHSVDGLPILVAGGAKRPVEDRLSHRRRQQPGVACRLDIAKGVGGVGGYLGQRLVAGPDPIHGIAGVAQ